MSYQSPPDKTVVTPDDPWFLREVGKAGIRFGGVLFWDEDLRPLVGLQFAVRPLGAQHLQISLGVSKDQACIEYLYAEAQSFVDPEAVDSFLSLRDLVPRPPYKPFFSTTTVVEDTGPGPRKRRISDGFFRLGDLEYFHEQLFGFQGSIAVVTGCPGEQVKVEVERAGRHASLTVLPMEPSTYVEGV